MCHKNAWIEDVNLKPFHIESSNLNGNLRNLVPDQRNLNNVQMQIIFDHLPKGEVGHIRLIKVTSRDSPLPSMAYLKISGGIFHDCAVHDIDMITWILGELPLEVYAVANAQIPEIGAIGDFDNIVVTFKFSSGLVLRLRIVDQVKTASRFQDRLVSLTSVAWLLMVMINESKCSELVE